MGSVQRYERIDSWMFVSGAVTDSDGFLRDSPIVARTGIYIYQQPDGTIRREYRPPSEGMQSKTACLNPTIFRASRVLKNFIYVSPTI